MYIPVCIHAWIQMHMHIYVLNINIGYHMCKYQMFVLQHVNESELVGNYKVFLHNSMMFLNYEFILCIFFSHVAISKNYIWE